MNTRGRLLTYSTIRSIPWFRRGRSRLQGLRGENLDEAVLIGSMDELIHELEDTLRSGNEDHVEVTRIPLTFPSQRLSAVVDAAINAFTKLAALCNRVRRRGLHAVFRFLSCRKLKAAKAL